jgi:hypothetical protein
MLKQIGSDLYQRVIVAHKTTLLGLGLIAASVLAEALAASPNKIVSVIGGLVGTGLVLYKGKALPPAP